MTGFRKTPPRPGLSAKALIGPRDAEVDNGSQGVEGMCGRPFSRSEGSDG